MSKIVVIGGGVIGLSMALAFVEITAMLALPQEIMARPGLVDRIMDVAGGREAVMPPGPSRDDLLRSLA